MPRKLWDTLRRLTGRTSTPPGPKVLQPVADIEAARARIADCLQLDAEGRLQQRRDHLNLAGLGLTAAELAAPFDPQARGLPEISLADLPHLRYLDLTGNALEELPAGVTACPGLVWLGLNFNRLARLPASLGALTNLQRLYLRGNALTELPEEIGNLKALVELDLTGCPIPSLPASLARLEGLGHLALEEAALAPDLRAAWREKGWQSLRGHLALRAAAAVTTQFVGKVVLVGPQENGKTCLQRALRGEPFIAGHRSTDGMSRERLHLGRDGRFIGPEERARSPGPGAEVIDLTLWDMGGQESYQHTHQMFFTPSAVYLLVTLPRQGGGVQDLDRWIELVKRRTEGRATMIVVSTWCRQHPPDAAITLAELQAKHGDLVRALMAVDSQDNTGIPGLRGLLAAEVQQERSGCRHQWLPGWAQMLEELANSRLAFLRWTQVRRIAAKHGIKDAAQQRQVIRTGHYIGALLWREDIPAGEDVVILNPDWLCRAVARLLDDEDTRAAHGLVDTDKLDRVWSQPGRDGTPGYAKDSHPALIELMEINELAYRPRQPGKAVGEGTLLLVTQMVEDTPERDVAQAWQAISPQAGAETVRVIAFRQPGRLGYEAVPDLVYLLIFRLREFSLGRADYRQAVHWQRGLLVTDDYGSAGRIELDGTELRITVRHRLGDGLMHSIVHRLGTRDDGFWSGRGLEKVEFVPCGRACAGGTPDAGLISMESCAKADRAGNPSVECQSCHEYVPIRELLSLRAYVPEDLRSLLARLDALERNLLAGIREDGEATRRDIAQLDRLVRMQGDGILDAFTSKWKEGPRLFSLVPVKGPAWNPRTWMEMDFRVVVWCEASRRPVPLFRQPKPGGRAGEFRGSETITLTRDWVRGARKALTWGSRAAFALATGGALGGLVTAVGGVISPADQQQLAEEFGRQQAIFKELLEALPEGGEGARRAGSPAPATGGADDFGTPEEADLKLIRFLRDKFQEQDPAWGGLEPRNDGKFGRLWAHPEAGATAD